MHFLCAGAIGVLACVLMACGPPSPTVSPSPSATSAPTRTVHVGSLPVETGAPIALTDLLGHIVFDDDQLGILFLFPWVRDPENLMEPDDAKTHYILVASPRTVVQFVGALQAPRDQIVNDFAIKMRSVTVGEIIDSPQERFLVALKHC